MAAATFSLDEETTREVLRQVEYYFSDSNIPRDNFMRNTISSSEDGLISLALICSFKKMRGYLKLGDIKQDEVPEDTLKAVAETLRKSTFLKVSDDGMKVGRLVPLASPEQAIEQLDTRTIAASPLKHNVKRDDLESLFVQYGKVTSVRMPHHVADKRVFCGTALIEFSTEEETEKVLLQEINFDGVQLEIKPKKEFDAERAKMCEEIDSSQVGSDNKNKSDAGPTYPKGLIVAFTLKRISDGGSVEQNEANDIVNKDDNASNAVEVTPTEIATMGQDKVSEKTVADEESPEDSSCDKNGSGSEANQKWLSSSANDIVNKDDNASNAVEVTPTEIATMEQDKVSEKTVADEESPEDSSCDKNGSGSEANQVGDGDTPSLDHANNDNIQEKPNFEAYKDNKDVVSREDLKVVFGKFGTVKFVDFHFGAESGYIRFEQPDAAQKARAAAVLANEGGLVVKNFVASLEPVTGDAERDYWKLLRDHQDNRRGNNGGRGRGGKYHRGGGKRARSGGRDSARGRPNKARKFGA